MFFKFTENSHASTRALHKTMLCVTCWHEECKLLQKLPGALLRLHVFLRRRTHTRSSPDFGCLLTCPWLLRWYEMGFFSFFSVNGAKSSSLSSFRRKTQKETIIQGDVSCDNESCSWHSSQATQLLMETAENLREQAEGEEDMSQYSANSTHPTPHPHPPSLLTNWTTVLDLITAPSIFKQLISHSVLLHETQIAVRGD